MSRNGWIALLAALGVAAAAVAGALLAKGSTDSTPQQRAPTAPTSAQGFSLPLALSSSSLALAKHEGNLLVGIAARPGGPVEVAALRAETPLATDELRVEVGHHNLDAEPCGRGCSRVAAPVLNGSPVRLSVRAGSSRLSFALPARLPADGDDVLARAEHTMGRLHSYRFTERLSSGAETVTTKLEVQAPDRLRLRTSTGFRSVIIGRNRWDFAKGHWEHVPFPGLDVAGVLMWSRAKHPRIITRRPHRITELAAFGLQPVPAWFRVAVNPSGRVVEAEMIAASHFMVHRYSDFNSSVSIRPPVRR
ncbi:MAG TPA: hypothetical protein VF877_05535 [Gaiellaceae bacterium]